MADVPLLHLLSSPLLLAPSLPPLSSTLRMVRNPGKFGKAKRGGGRQYASPFSLLPSPFSPLLVPTRANANLLSHLSFSRDLSRLDPEGNPEGKGSDGSSSEESSSEEEEEDPRSRLGQLPPIAGSDSEDDAPTSGLARNLNASLSLAPAVGPDGEVVVARTGAKLTPDQVAEARKARKAANKGGKGPAGGANKGSGSDEEEEENENKRGQKTMKVADLGAPREMSRREKCVLPSF